MKVKINPSNISGKITAPPSKSMAHRLLICAGLSSGISTVKNVAPSEDVLATLDCISALGDVCEYDGKNVKVCGKDKIAPHGEMQCRECGSTLRFFIPICLLSEEETVLSGSERLLSRPLEVYEKMCRERGLLFSNDGRRVRVRGKLTPGKYSLAGNVSSQFVSGLLFALPTLHNDSEIILEGGVESRPYIDMTISALEKFGVFAEWRGENRIFVSGNQKYAPVDVTVEGDCSNAAFFEALNALDGSVEVNGISDDTVQGDKIYGEYIAALKNGAPTLSLADCPDLGPIMFAVAAIKNGATFTNTHRLKIKESDRVLSMAAELSKFGAELEIFDDSVIIKSAPLHRPEVELCSHNDHRVAMALSVLMTKYGGVLDGAEAVKKSMPDFYDAISSLGAEVEFYDR